eukprot:Partr_v1_DN27011_c1_g1_i2_m28713 putative CobW domain-containing protein
MSFRKRKSLFRCKMAGESNFFYSLHLISLNTHSICCTLREDLVQEICRLGEEGIYDYLIIESTGISEPLQVAETFSQEFAGAVLEGDDTELADTEMRSILEAGGLGNIAELDTCVTVVDCLNFFDTFETTEFLADRYGDEINEGDERTITDLMVDQIEFANVILLNKIDLASEETICKVKAILSQMNPVAKIIATRHSEVDITEVIGTKLFDFEKASTSAGWLQTIHDLNGNGVKSESEEYGVASFVYTARRPFHPHRLHDLLADKFLIIQNDFGVQEEVSDDDDEMQDSEEAALTAEEREEHGRLIAASKRSCKIFNPVLRSKGFVWLASAPFVSGELSQAGCVLTMDPGSPWFCTVPEDEWPEEATESIKKDFDGEWGDRRQEVVFIGASMDQESIRNSLSLCLLSDDEWALWQSTMRECSKLPENGEDALAKQLNDMYPDNPWAPWDFEMEDEEMDEADDSISR